MNRPLFSSAVAALSFALLSSCAQPPAPKAPAAAPAPIKAKKSSTQAKVTHWMTPEAESGM